MIDLERLGWSQFFQIKSLDNEDLQPARIVADWGARFTVAGATGEAPAVARRSVNSATPPAVGDWVLVRCPAAGGPAVVEQVLPRRNTLERKAPGGPTRVQVLATNVDVVFVVQGLDGDFNLRRLERTVAAVWASGAEPVVLLNKLDLAVERTMLHQAARVVPGVAVHPVCAMDGRGVDVIPGTLAPNRTGVLVGSSGAGKSTLLNRLLGSEVQATAAVREDDSRGRHTTTARRLFLLPAGGALIDGPGIRELQLWDTGDALERTFSDIEALARGCRYRDCGHTGEPGCAVAAAVAAGELPADRLASLH
jgi:ribosome biogenesis GTPase